MRMDSSTGPVSTSRPKPMVAVSPSASAAVRVWTARGFGSTGIPEISSVSGSKYRPRGRPGTIV